MLAQISAMCSLRDLLAIGFSNGVLILLDTAKLDIVFAHKHFTKNDKPIDKLKVFNVGDSLVGREGGVDSVFMSGASDSQTTLLFSLSDGLLSYHNFPKVTLVDELIMESNIVDF